MYTLDTNLNTAIKRQADRVRAVQAYGSRQGREQAAPSWAADGTGRINPVSRQDHSGPSAGKAILALAAAAPIVLLVVWGLMTH